VVRADRELMGPVGAGGRTAGREVQDVIVRMMPMVAWEVKVAKVAEVATAAKAEMVDI
jgi:hypothetical protein